MSQNNRKIVVQFANCTKFIALTYEQYEAMNKRNLKLFKDSGLNLDIYLSLIDPDYPVIVAG
jgi:hypothetical protein